MLALVLSGGGARGAYQAGVINALAEISANLGIRQPFGVFTGVSAGALNSCFLAARANDFLTSSEKLSQLWSELKSEQVFYTDPLSLSKIGLKWMRDLPLGGITGQSAGPSLLNTEPLRSLILEHIDFSQIQNHIDKKILSALAITAVDYHSSMASTFIQGDPKHEMWVRSRRFSERVLINPDHVMASSAIPLLFPPIQVGDRYYGDGCVRNQAPMSPALHLGADRLIVVGVRRQTNIVEPYKKGPPSEPTMARVFNVLLNAVLLDGIELDVERMNRINEFMDKLPADYQEVMNFKKIECCWIHPSLDIGQLAFDHSRKLPRFIRYLLRGLGPNEDAKEIISYLLFDPEFCQTLILGGYEDAMKQKDKIEKMLTDEKNNKPL
jgi:NTE family protein